MAKRAIKIWEYKFNGYKRRIKLYKDGVHHYYEIYVGKKEDYVDSFRDCLNRHYPIGYTAAIDTEVMCLVAERMENLDELNEKEKKFYNFWKYLDCSKIPTKRFKSSYDKSYITISPTGVRVKIHPNNGNSTDGEECLDSIFFHGPEIPAMSLEDRIKLQDTLFKAIHKDANLSISDAFPLFDFSKLTTVEHTIGDRDLGKSLHLDTRGYVYHSSWDRWDGGGYAVSLEEAWRHREKNMLEGEFKKTYKEIYKVMEKAIITR